ncbi:hypothetical protein IC575_010175 [Cucumis melo]
MVWTHLVAAVVDAMPVEFEFGTRRTSQWQVLIVWRSFRGGTKAP